MAVRRVLTIALLVGLAGACRDGTPPPAGSDARPGDLAAPEAASGDGFDGFGGDAALDRAREHPGGGGVDASTDPTCGPGAPRSMLCATYCEGIGRFCTRVDTQFRNADECRAACLGPTWACGQPGDLTGDSLFCRLSHTALAGIGDSPAGCANAGPNSPVCR